VLLSDKTLTCMDCGYQFTFTASEQVFFASKAYTNEPRRCSQCRSARKSQQRDSRESYGSTRGMHAAICAECGKDALVPFRPRNDKPVYCSNCFSSMRFPSYRHLARRLLSLWDTSGAIPAEPTPIFSLDTKVVPSEEVL
jgi:CxxC-x17-CxxC domain-containing protein